MFALMTLGLLSTGSFAQNGGRDTTKHGGDHRDTTHIHWPGDPGRDTGKGGDNDHDSTIHNPQDTLHHGDPGKDTTNHGGRDTSIHHNGGKGGQFGDHGRVNLDRLLHSDSCRLALEAQMTPADAAALEADLAALKANADQIKTLLGQLRDAYKAKDTATIHALAGQLRTLLATQRTDAKALSDLLANYTSIINKVWHDCTMKGHNTTNGNPTDLRLEVKPIFPNPVSSKGTNAGGVVTLNYSISADADVNITVADMQGNIVQQVAQDREVAGQHTATINASSLTVGLYYVRIQAGTLVQTQKLMVIQ